MSRSFFFFFPRLLHCNEWSWTTKTRVTAVVEIIIFIYTTSQKFGHMLLFQRFFKINRCVQTFDCPVFSVSTSAVEFRSTDDSFLWFEHYSLKNMSRWFAIICYYPLFVFYLSQSQSHLKSFHGLDASLHISNGAKMFCESRAISIYLFDDYKYLPLFKAHLCGEYLRQSKSVKQ